MGVRQIVALRGDSEGGAEVPMWSLIWFKGYLRSIELFVEATSSSREFNTDALRNFSSITSLSPRRKLMSIPGILPVTNFNTLVRFAKACGASTSLYTLFAVDRERPTEDFHFYTLSYSVCHALGSSRLSMTREH